MFRGFATISFYADDLAAARDWYAQLLEVQPYYVFPEQPASPAYVEFRIGDDQDERGFIDPRLTTPRPRTHRHRPGHLRRQRAIQ